MTLVDSEEENLVVILISIETLALMQLVGVFFMGLKYFKFFCQASLKYINCFNRYAMCSSLISSKMHVDKCMVT